MQSSDGSKTLQGNAHLPTIQPGAIEIDEQDSDDLPQQIFQNPTTASLVKFAQFERDQHNLEFKEPKPRNEK